MPDKPIVVEIISTDYKSEAEKTAEIAKAKRAVKAKTDLEKKAQIKQKTYFDVKIECMLPATLTYRVLAEDAQQAVELIKGTQPNSVQHRLIGRKELKLTVYDAGSTIIKWMKRLVG